MYSQSSNQKKVFCRGITLKDYLRKSQVLITQDNRDETLLVDEFNNPLVKIEDFVFLKEQVPSKVKFDTSDFSTKVSNTKSIDEDPFLSNLQNRKQMNNSQIKIILRHDNSELSNKSRKKTKPTYLPPLELSKSKNMKPQNLKAQTIKIKVLSRQKCMASRQISEQSEDQLQIFKIPEQKNLSNREYIEQVKKGIKHKRQFSFHKKNLNQSRMKCFSFQNRSSTQEV